MKRILNKKNPSRYKLAQINRPSCTTLSEFCCDRDKPAQYSAETRNKLAQALSMSRKDSLPTYLQERATFDIFKSNVCHQVKDMGDLPFILTILKSGKIWRYYERGWFREAFYLLAMLDYLSRVNGLPLCSNYADLRKLKLAEPIFSSSVIVLDLLDESLKIKEQAIAEAIPEFMRFNLVEGDIRNVY